MTQTESSFTASDWIAYARISQMIEDLLVELGGSVDPEGPTQVVESIRDTIIDV